jgi:hypothetical protein
LWEVVKDEGSFRFLMQSDFQIWWPSWIWFPDNNLSKSSQIDFIFLGYNGDAQEKVPFDFWCDPTSRWWPSWIWFLDDNCESTQIMPSCYFSTHTDKNTISRVLHCPQNYISPTTCMSWGAFVVLPC